MKRGTSLAALLVTMIANEPASAPTPPNARPVEAALRGFLTDFENLDWDGFRSHFSDQACVFFPSASTPGVFCGREAVEKRFQQEFETIRRNAPSGPPFMHLHPDSLRIEMLGTTAALVTFELHNAVRVGRRTILFRREGKVWRIAHLHASNVPWPDEHK